MRTLQARAAETPFSAPQIGHAEIAAFADNSVNLKREDAKEYREQVGRLREKLDKYAADHPDYGLIKTLLSGSLAKGTALKTKPATAFLCELIAMLQSSATVPTIDIGAYARWLEQSRLGKAARY